MYLLHPFTKTGLIQEAQINFLIHVESPNLLQQYLHVVLWVQSFQR